MELKKIGIAIIIMGIIIAGYGVIRYLSEVKAAKGDWGTGYLGSLMGKDDAKDSLQGAMPFMVVGGAIAIAGLIISASKKKQP